MSVAFRRESDEEHLEPRFERPIPPGPNLVTARGLEAIEADIRRCEKLIEQGADEVRLAELNRDLRYWRARHASARPKPAPSAGEIALGSRVRFRQADGTVVSVDIVGHDEADPAAGRVAFSAPLARALIGAEAGDRVDFSGRASTLEILDASPIPA